VIVGIPKNKKDCEINSLQAKDNAYFVAEYWGECTTYCREISTHCNQITTKFALLRITPSTNILQKFPFALFFSSTMQTASVLIIDDNHDVLLSLRLLLKHHYASVHTEHDPTRVAGILAQKPYDIAIMDMNFTANVMSG
jgi:hypothetical protein